MTSQVARIFVLIPSYRDRECASTIRDLLRRASRPERIDVGVCLQGERAEEAEELAAIGRPGAVRVDFVDWRESEGVSWARRRGQALWRGEEYALQVDAHTRFCDAWDELLLAELALCDAPRPVLSHSPAGYTPPDQRAPDPRANVRRAAVDAAGNLRGRGEALARAPELPLRGALVATRLIFSRAELLQEVPHDPSLYVDQEELAYSARIFTHGWDVFSGRAPLLYHHYGDGRGGTRPQHWRDLRERAPEVLAALRRRSQRRLDHLVGRAQAEDPEVLREIERHGLGEARSLREFEAFVGIDLRQRRVSERALQARFIPGLERWRDGPFRLPERDLAALAAAGPASAPAAVVAPAVAPAAGRLRCEPGDFLPLFELVDHQGRTRALELYAGRPVALVLLPADPRAAEAAAAVLRVGWPEDRAWLLMIGRAPPERLRELRERAGLTTPLWSDDDGALATALGARPEAISALWLTPNLRVASIHLGADAEALARELRAAAPRRLEARPALVTGGAPALFVPDALTPELCRRCIAAWEGGDTDVGGVTTPDRTSYRPDAKRRRDLIVEGPLQAALDDKLSRSFFPELRKVFGFEVTHRERYKIGCYDAADGGFFRQHRDNFDEALGYRRIAATIHLSGDFEGGGLRFPEYGDAVHRPPPGGAIAFSCATLHEALPVTAGRRFVLVGFFHGAADEALRQRSCRARGRPPRADDYVVQAPPPPPGVRQSRDFARAAAPDAGPERPLEPRVICVGMITADIAVGPVGEVASGTLVHVDAVGLHPGGCALNSAIGLARLGVASAIAGPLGADRFGEYLRDEARAAGVDVSGVALRGGLVTSSTVLLVRPGGQRDILQHAGSNAALRAADVDLARYPAATHLHLGGYFTCAGFDGDEAAALLRRAREAGLQTSLDTAWDPAGRWSALLRPALPHLDVLMTNEDEGRALTGEDDPERIAARLAEGGVGVVIVKLGARGCLVRAAGATRAIAALPAAVVDTTGAGDAFAAGFLAGRVWGLDVWAAARVGCAAGARATEAMGATAGLVGRAHVLALLGAEGAALGA